MQAARRKSQVALVAALTTLVSALTACRTTELTSSDDGLRPSRVQIANDQAQRAIANVGCSLGIDAGENGSKVILLSRAQLPFQLPAVPAPPQSQRVLRMRVARISVPLLAPHRPAMLACLVPANGRTSAKIRDAVAGVDQVTWTLLSARVASEGTTQPHALSRGVALMLLDSTLKTDRTHRGAAEAGIASFFSDPPATRIAGVTVTANANVVTVDYSFVSRLFASNFEAVVLTWDMYIAQQQWTQDCNEWNAEMDIWDATREAVEDAADEEAEAIEGLANVLEASIASLETATASCVPTNGKMICIDFFIMNCKLLVVQAGDCRGFDPDADYSSSRVQLYLNPVTQDIEVKYNCSKFVIPNPAQSGGPDWVITAVCDSADVFNPATDLHKTPPDANGWQTVSMSFRNNACIRRLDFLCPAINAIIWLRQDASAPGGFQVAWDRDGFPSMGIYARNSSDTGWETVKEDAQITRDGVRALRALAGKVRSRGYNYPTPGGQPQGCMRQ